MPLVVGGRVTGPSHAKAGKGCDDAFAWISFPDGAQVLAVADGAGSVTGTSAWGSWAATQYVTTESNARLLVDELSSATDEKRVEEVLRIAFLGALQNVMICGKLMGLAPESMNTTLCIAVLIPDHTYVAEIGDGIIAVMRHDRAETVLMEAKGESAATDTYFLQLLARNSHHAQWRCGDCGPTPAIALSTDGLRYQATSIKDDYAAHPGFFETLWNLLEAGKVTRTSLENWLETKTSVNDPPGDDKTLLLAIRRPVGASRGENADGVRRDCSPRPPKVTVEPAKRSATPSAPKKPSPDAPRQDSGNQGPVQTPGGAGGGQADPTLPHRHAGGEVHAADLVQEPSERQQGLYERLRDRFGLTPAKDDSSDRAMERLRGQPPQYPPSDGSRPIQPGPEPSVKGVPPQQMPSPGTATLPGETMQTRSGQDEETHPFPQSKTPARQTPPAPPTLAIEGHEQVTPPNTDQPGESCDPSTRLWGRA